MVPRAQGQGAAVSADSSINVSAVYCGQLHTSRPCDDSETPAVHIQLLVASCHNAVVSNEVQHASTNNCCDYFNQSDSVTAHVWSLLPWGEHWLVYGEGSHKGHCHRSCRLVGGVLHRVEGQEGVAGIKMMWHVIERCQIYIFPAFGSYFCLFLCVFLLPSLQAGLLLFWFYYTVLHLAFN